MAKTPGVWERRVRRMQDAGFSREQVELVFDLFDEARGFRSNYLSEYARSVADRLYASLDDAPFGTCPNCGHVYSYAGQEPCVLS